MTTSHVSKDKSTNIEPDIVQNIGKVVLIMKRGASMNTTVIYCNLHMIHPFTVRDYSATYRTEQVT